MNKIFNTFFFANLYPLKLIFEFNSAGILVQFF
jgi:hypothetical protein